MLEEDYLFACPYCGVSQTIRLETGGGAKQQMVTDCEICCRPILITAEYDGDEMVHFSAEREND